MPEVKLYAERMLNPFHGVVNVVEIEGADAVSRNGTTWSLYVHGERETLADDPHCGIPTPDIKFGTWSAAGGLKRAPVRSTTDYLAVEHSGMRLLSAVEHHAARLPFGLVDRHELWLLDARTRLPLALLQSAREAPRGPCGPAPPWTPGELCRRSFRAQGDRDEAHAGDALGRIVNTAAGRPAAAQWFRREPDGSGTSGAGTHLDEGLTGRRLSGDAFPELLLRTEWPEPDQRRLIREFLDWQAPWLLLLPSLDPELRARLEQAACRQAERVADQFRLYPNVIDNNRIRAALVEAKLRETIPARSQPSTDDLSPFYIEL